MPHRWDGTTVIVATDAEPTVDELLDAIEQGTLVLSSGPAGATAPEGALDTLFTSSDRLARDPDDAVGREELTALVAALEPTAPPYGVSVGAWAKAVVAATRAGRPHRRRGFDVVGHHRRRPDPARHRPPVRLSSSRTRLRRERPSASEGASNNGLRGRGTPCVAPARADGTPVLCRHAAGRAGGVAHATARADAAGGARQPRAARRPGARVRWAPARRRRRRPHR